MTHPTEVSTSTHTLLAIAVQLGMASELGIAQHQNWGLHSTKYGSCEPNCISWHKEAKYLATVGAFLGA